MTDWTQRIEELDTTWASQGRDAEHKYAVRNFLTGAGKTDITRLMNEYAIERLEELKGEAHSSPEAELVVPLEDIEAMQRSLKERLAKGGVE